MKVLFDSNIYYDIYEERIRRSEYSQLLSSKGKGIEYWLSPVQTIEIGKHIFGDFRGLGYRKWKKSRPKFKAILLIGDDVTDGKILLPPDKYIENDIFNVLGIAGQNVPKYLLPFRDAVEQEKIIDAKLLKNELKRIEKSWVTEMNAFRRERIAEYSKALRQGGVPVTQDKLREIFIRERKSPAFLSTAFYNFLLGRGLYRYCYSNCLINKLETFRYYIAGYKAHLENLIINNTKFKINDYFDLEHLVYLREMDFFVTSEKETTLVTRFNNGLSVDGLPKKVRGFRRFFDEYVDR
jgi:hypothetical protein